MKSIIIIGGDKRQIEMKNILSQQDYRCTHINSSDKIENGVKINKGNIIILPVPISKDRETVYSSESRFFLMLNEVLSKLDHTNFLLGGGFSQTVKAYLDTNKIPYLDYLDCEEFVIYNAYLTGLGAVRLLYENTCEDIRDSKVLVTGFGRVSKYTAKALKQAGCEVYVCARNQNQLADAECMGYRIINFDKVNTFLYLFDYIFNTVPVNIFSFEDVSHIKGKYFELASAPFGVKKEYFSDRESRYIFGGALPGRYLPYSAAEKLSEITVKHINLRNGGD